VRNIFEKREQVVPLFLIEMVSLPCEKHFEKKRTNGIIRVNRKQNTNPDPQKSRK